MCGGDKEQMPMIALGQVAAVGTVACFCVTSWILCRSQVDVSRINGELYWMTPVPCFPVSQPIFLF